MIGPHRLLLVAHFSCLVAVTLSATAADFKPTQQKKIVPADSKLELVWADGDFTEGPALAGDGSIIFSDIGNRILKYEPATGKTSVFRDPGGRTNGLMFNAKGELIACEGANTGGGRRISITGTDGKVKTLADRFEGKRFNSPNDLAVTKQGQVYFTDPRYVGEEPRELDIEAVFLVETDGKVKLATKELQKPNGILVSPDGRTVFVADNNSLSDGNHHLVSFAVREDGTLHQKKVLWDIGPNRRGIDGMTQDQQGRIYATAGTGDLAGVYVLSPSGDQLAFIATPGDPTNCVFGGDDRCTLYITAQAPAPANPRKFGLYRIQLTTPGHHLFPAKPE